MALESRIEAQHVIDKRHELAQQFDTHQAATDHDDRLRLDLRAAFPH